MDIQKAKDLLNSKEEFTFDDLCLLTDVLRSPEGCPWDREQTNKSIRNAFIDETYEFIEGLDADNNELMCEELGDVLFQIVFHACVKNESCEFSINDVIDGICKKMILRHPHVFGNTDVKDSAEVLVKWEQIKNVEKARKTPYEQLKSVAVTLPSLMRAAKLQSKAEKTGLTEQKDAAFYAKEVKKATLEVEDGKCDVETLSQLLFAAAGLCKKSGFDPEELLYHKNNQFLKQFSK